MSDSGSLHDVQGGVVEGDEGDDDDDDDVEGGVVEGDDGGGSDPSVKNVTLFF